MVTVKGIGWVDKKEYGSIRKGTCYSYKDGLLPRKMIFSMPFKNFGRLDNASRLTCAAVSLALNDADIECSINMKHDIGLITSSHLGCLETDRDYFGDYLESGRTLARGNLFIYTLPSSPSGEAAIHFGLQGPLLYITSLDVPFLSAVETAGEIIEEGDSRTMVAGLCDENGAVYFVLQSDSAMYLCSIDAAKKMLAREMSISGIVKAFSELEKGKTA